MRFLFRNLHVFVFASLSAFAAFWVASNADQAEDLARPLVEDAIELQVMAKNAYREVRQLDLQKAADDAIRHYVAALRMPSLLFDRLADEIGEVNDKMEQSVRVDPAALSDASVAHGRPASVRVGVRRSRRIGAGRYAPLSI